MIGFTVLCLLDIGSSLREGCSKMVTGTRFLRRWAKLLVLLGAAGLSVTLTWAKPVGAFPLRASQGLVIAVPVQPSPGLPTGFGSNSLGAFGAPPSDGPTPVPVTSQNGSTQAAMGCSHGLYLHPDGTVWASGWNNFGQLGDGGSANSSTPIRVAGLSDVVAVAAGCYHSMALEANGTVMIWGQNQGVTTSNPADGSCPGLGDPQPCFVHPTQWVGPVGVTQIAAGVETDAALASDGTVFTGGQLGNSHLTLPAPAADLALESYTALAATATGVVYQWGASQTPAAVQGIGGYAVQVGGGSLTGYAVTTDGTVWAWGDDRYGQLGDGGTASRSTAQKVPGLPPMTEVAGGFYHAVSLDRAGNVWAWGDNVDGEVGPQQPSAVDALPSAVPNLGTVSAVAAGGYSTIVLVENQGPPTTVPESSLPAVLPIAALGLAAGAVLFKIRRQRSSS